MHDVVAIPHILLYFGERNLFTASGKSTEYASAQK